MQMIETVKNAWKIADLRKKILFTLFIILIFRIGSVIPAPFIDFNALQAGVAEATAEGNADFFNYYSVLSGGGLEYGSIFAMGVTPYINSSIIMQLLCVAIPPLERLSQEGEEGRKKIAQYTRYATVILGLLQATAYFFYLKGNGSETYLTSFVSGGFSTWFAAIVIISVLTAGSALVMWLGEQVDKNGIGNGISILLFAGIISRFPSAVRTMRDWIVNDEIGKVIGTVILFLVIVAYIVWMTAAERRIPVQYAKKVVGRKMYGGQNSHIPIKVNMSGVMPIIFASSILMIPTMILSFMKTKEGTMYNILSLFSSRGVFYAVLYFLFIIGFAYFYVTIQYNPVEMANNLRKSSGAIPGIRPGKPTAEFIKKILSRVTLLGAIMLSVIALLPIFISMANQSAISIGGTSILIVVGVALDTVQNLESQTMMRHYKGFLD